LEANAHSAGWNALGLARLGQRLDALQPREAAARRREGTLREIDDPAHGLERPDELQQQRREERELAVREIPGDHLAAAEEEHHRERERREVEEPGQVLCLDSGLAQDGVADARGLAGETAANVVLAP